MSTSTLRKLVLRCALMIFAIASAQPALRAAAVGGEPVNVWLTTHDLSNHLTPQQSLTFAPDNGSDSSTIDVNENRTYQQIDGFGATLTESSAWLLMTKLTNSQRSAVMQDLFGAGQPNNIGLNFLRQPMGATDYITTTVSISHFFTYDDLPPGQTDPGLNNFNLADDPAYIIPILQGALGINHNIKILASPWSAPAWMKDNRALNNGGNLLPADIDVWANYFVKFIQAYQNHGIPIWGITPQNEPGLAVPWPSMYLSSTDESNFIANHLAPALATAGLSPKILAWDFNWDNTTYPLSVLGNAGAGSKVAGTSWHCYVGDPSAMSTVHQAYPGKDVYETECAAGCSQVVQPIDLVIGAMRNWSRSAVTWNIALDPSGGPHFSGNPPGCTPLVTVDPNIPTTGVSYGLNYYEEGQASKFVVPGAYRIDSNTFGAGSIQDVAFKNPDGSKVLVVHNTDTSNAHTFKVRWSGESFSYNLPANASATFEWTGSGLNASGLQGYWRFDESSGPTAADASINGNGGILQGNATRTAGKVGPYALSLDGSNGTDVAVGNPAALNFGAGSFSVAAWFKTTATGFNRIVSKGNYGWTPGYWMSVGHGADGRVATGLGGGSPGNSILFWSNNTFNDGQWHHAVAVYDRAGGTAQLYVDGVAQNVTEISGSCASASGTTVNISACSNATATGSDPFSIGSHDGTAEFFNGSIDDVRAYDRALGPQEIQNLANG